MVADGRFREDLLFRLRTIAIELPPLRERAADIEELTIYFVGRFCEQNAMKVKGISPAFLEALSAYEWPGNIREIRNTIEGVLLTTARHDSMLFPNHLPDHIRIRIAQASLKKGGASPDSMLISVASSGSFPKLHEVLDNVKRQYLENLVARTGANMEEASRISGISRSRLYDHLRRFGISIPRGPFQEP